MKITTTYGYCALDTYQALCRMDTEANRGTYQGAHNRPNPLWEGR